MKDYSNYNFPGMAKSITEMYEKKAAEKEKRAAEKAKDREEREAIRKESMTMDEMKMRAGGKVSSASKRADGCAIRGKTKGKMV